MQSRRHRQPKIAPPPLADWITIQEAAELFFCAENTIRYHMDRGNIAFWKIGGERRGIYLISKQSLVALYGCPKSGI